MKKVVIFQTSGNELANQLWNYASVFAYAREKGYEVENPAFFEYGNYFPNAKAGFFFKLFFFLPFTNYTKRKFALRRRIWRKLYFWYAKIVFHFIKNRLIVYKDQENKPYYLPPTINSPEVLRQFETTVGNIYFDSWLLRNPVGLEKYRDEIHSYFKPRKDINDVVVSQMKEWRKKGKMIVGIHVRQGDYKTWRGGAYLIKQSRVREIIDEYLSVLSKNKDEVFFVFTSDGSIDEKFFDGLSFTVSKNNAIADLFLLSSTDSIIGSDSSFGAFAAYYGNVPFIVMQSQAMDWEYYRDKKTFFENKYSTVVHY